MNEPDPINIQIDSSAAEQAFPPKRVWRLPRALLWMIAVGLLGVVTFMQRPEAPDPAETKLAIAGMEPVVAPKKDVLILMGKLKEALRTLSPPSVGQIQDSIDPMGGYVKPNPFARPTSATEPPEKFPAVDRLRVTMLGADGLKKSEIASRLDGIAADLDPESVLRDDVKLLRSRLVGEARDGSDDLVPVSVADLDPAKREAFKKRHGWFAEMALTADDLKADFRTKAAESGAMILVLLMLVLSVVGLAILAGLVFLIIGLVQLTSGSLRLHMKPLTPASDWPNASGDDGGDPRVGAGVWLETVAIFLASFLALKLVGSGLHAALVSKDGASPTWLPWVSILGQWLCMLAIVWPRVRGMSRERWCREIGWHRGQGVFKEIGCGIMGYLAGLPLYFAMALLMVIIMLVFSGSGSPKPPDNKVLDLVEGGSPLALFAVFLLATIWAPIVEESIFRGALFGHLRRRMPLIVAALGSCMVFAVLHGYMFMQLFVVGTLGFWFAIMREWRGSLIASATGHFIHNAFVLSVMIVIFSLAQA